MPVDAERQAFADVFRSTDPDAPTLCEGWTTRHLLAHLVQREQGPTWAAIGDMVGHREPGQEKYMGRLVKAARSDEGYEALVTQFQKGAPRWSPMSWADESLNFIEYVIHIEDVRRGGDTPLLPRVLPPAPRTSRTTVPRTRSGCTRSRPARPRRPRTHSSTRWRCCPTTPTWRRPVRFWRTTARVSERTPPRTTCLSWAARAPPCATRPAHRPHRCGICR